MKAQTGQIKNEGHITRFDGQQVLPFDEPDEEDDPDLEAAAARAEKYMNYPMTVTKEELDSQKVEIESGRAKTTPWREVRVNALHG
ncbi:MAG: hypothetical protein LBH03_06290 [Holophagales bacterium]|nr:hypothetical protein [Holophagales bacterium]